MNQILNLFNRKRGRPLVFKNVKAYGSFGIDIWMINPSFERKLEKIKNETHKTILFQYLTYYIQEPLEFQFNCILVDITLGAVKG